MSEDLIYNHLLADIEKLKKERQWLAEKLVEWCKEDMGMICPVDECRHLAPCFENTVDYILEVAREVTCINRE